MARTPTFRGPTTFLYFIVARVGPGGRHRPMAVAFLDTYDSYGSREARVVSHCIQVIKVLSAAENRAIIHAELSLAAGFYRASSDKRPPEPWAEPEHYSADPVWDKDIREFPFLSTALMVGLSRDVLPRARWRVPQPQPLSTAFRVDTDLFGMVVIDITELHNIQYGIVAFGLLSSDSDEDSGPGSELLPMFEEQQLRVPLSAAGYLDKFGYYIDEDFQESFTQLQSMHLIDTTAMDYIWPCEVENPNVGRRHGSRTANSLSHQAIRALIDSTQDVEARFDMSAFATPLKLPHFRDFLRRQLCDKPDSLCSAPAAGQLLSLAFAEQKEINWAPFKNISYGDIAAAIESPLLQAAESLTLCITRMQGDPNVLLETLGRLENLQHIIFLEDPRRSNDEASRDLFLRMSTCPSHIQLLQSKTITVSCSYSAPLRRRLWLPTTGYKLPPQIYPVQQMFTQRQTRLKGTKKFFPSYYYIGDGLLGPERFAAGFLRYLSSLGLDDRLLDFSRAPPSLEDFGEGRTGPLLAEVVSVPLNPITGRGHLAKVRNECWSKPRDLDEDSWTVLVSNDFCRERDPEHWPEYSRQPVARVVRYAFVRARRRITIDDRGAPIEPGDLEVCGLTEFLRATASQVASEVVQRRLEEASRDVAALSIPAPLDPGERWISVLDATAARSLLGDFLEDASFIRDNLRYAMTECPGDSEDPEEVWYPELLESVDIVDMKLPKRSGSVFIARGESNIQLRMAGP